MRTDIDEVKHHIDNAFRNAERLLDLSYLGLPALPPGLTDLTNLTTLLLGGNQLTTLPDSFGNLTNLTTLYLHGNQLTTLPDWLADLTALEHLSVMGNPLVSPPPEIVAGGSQSILAFIRARAEDSSAQWVSKLLVVGEGGVGKTSLLKALADERHDPEEPTTHGLKIRNLSLDHPTKPSIQMLLNAWDFGGQEIYHATHQFFLTNRSFVPLALEFTARLGAGETPVLAGYHHRTRSRVAGHRGRHPYRGPAGRSTDR